MQKQIYIVIFFLSLISAKSFAQDTLPRITVKNFNEKIIISWKKTYGAKISNINIQRSTDSLRNFRTIGTVLEPMNSENGYVDTKAPNSNLFYRVFVAFEGGAYVFTNSYRPVKDTIVAIANQPVIIKSDSLKTAPAVPAIPVPKGFVASKYIFTGKDNNVIIDLSDAGISKYSIQFFDEKHNTVFEIHKIIEPYLVIEKMNFLHSGWFYFKLFNNGVLKEKNQFYIPKEGKTGIPPEEANKIFK